jgi:hypothetical protein
MLNETKKDLTMRARQLIKPYEVYSIDELADAYCDAVDTGQEQLKDIWDATAELGLEHDVVVSPSVIPYDDYMKYKETLPYYRNIAEEGQKIG